MILAVYYAPETMTSSFFATAVPRLGEFVIYNGKNHRVESVTWNVNPDRNAIRDAQSHCRDPRYDVPVDTIAAITLSPI